MYTSYIHTYIMYWLNYFTLAAFVVLRSLKVLGSILIPFTPSLVMVKGK